MSKIIVVGGGPSGMMAALNASKSNHEVILLERNGELGRKLLLTGGGRCNITNNRDIEDFFDKVVNNKKFLYSSFYSFTNKDLLSYFEENNLEYKIETDNDHKVYTKSDKSEEVIEALKSDLKANKVKILYNTKVVDLIIENNTVIGVKTENNQTILADKVIISTGGKSYPNTGSDGMMYEILKKYGHTINKIYPALIPLTVKESFIKKLQGISSITGDEISKIIRENPNKNVINNLKGLLPQNFLKEIFNLLDLTDKKANELSKSDELKIVECIKSMKLTCNGSIGIKASQVTSGGVSVKEINSSTMESKLIENLFFTGEVIDVDAETGGYNLQIAFSTGYLAGISV